MRQVHITGDYVSVKPWGRIPSRGTAVKGVRLYSDGKYLGRTVSTPTMVAFDYVIEPDGDSLRIHYTPETGA